MGAKQKKINSWSFGIFSVLLIFACLMMALGTNLVGLQKVVPLVLTADDEIHDGSEVERYWGIDKGIRSSSYAQQENKVCYIRTAGQLAYMSYALTKSGSIESTEDYTGYTFVLENDIDLSKIYIQNIGKTVYPFWTPADVGSLGKNQNIHFNGNGHKIIGMRVKYEYTRTPYNAGFFANIIGGVIENVTFVNPTIVYSYLGTSVAETNPARPKKPTDVCVGVIAGAADSTYINQVNIVNPNITFTTDNVNAHNFYIGTAVGKLSLTTKFNEENKIATINTVSPKQWGLDTVSVYQDDNLKEDASTQTAVRINISQGSATNTTFGKACYGYFGGLVGANISSKVINSTIRSYNFLPQVASTTDGTYYVGGVAGLTTQITTAEDLLVASGLYNNLLLNLNLGEITTTSSRYCGDLVGRVYSGGWVYNNLVIGNMPYGRLWADVSNSLIRVGEHAGDCVYHINGALDPYYFDENSNYIGDLGCHYAEDEVDGHTYVYCSKQGHQNKTVRLDDAFSTETEMAKYNFSFISLTSPEYETFMDTIVYAPNEDDKYSQFDLMSSVDVDHGLLYFAVLPILKYETGLTIYEIDPNTNQAPTDEERLLEAVYQFRLWSKTPGLGSYFGAECSIKFIANYQDDLISDAYFVEDNGYGLIQVGPEKEVIRNYQQVIYEPDEPVCEGYEFLGWKIPGWEQDNADISTCPYVQYLDNNGFYQFGRERIAQEQRTFVAIWKLKTYTVSYIIRQYTSNDGGKTYTYQDIPYELKPTENVPFGNTLKGFSSEEQPTSNQGLRFIGWYAEPLGFNEDADPELAWKFGQANGDKMPGQDIALYAGWINNFTELSLLLGDADEADHEEKQTIYYKYYKNYEIYFSDASGLAYRNAFRAAWDARANEDNSNASELLANLKNTFAALRVAPKKLLNTPAFDETLIENSCPFLYKKDAYLTYQTVKNRTEKYANAEADDSVLKNIDAYIDKYEQISEWFDALKNNLKDTVAEAGLNSTRVKDLIKKYQKLEKDYQELIDSGEYHKYDTSRLDTAADTAKAIWTEKTNNTSVLRDVESVVADFENAFKNLQVKSNTSTDVNVPSDKKKNNKQNSSFNLGMPPVLFSVLIVAILVAGVAGYIGIDFALNKRRLKSSNKGSVAQQTETPDDETYI